VKGLAFLALSLVFLALGAMLISPIAQFVYEESINPKIFVINTSVSTYNKTHVKLIYVAEYNGTIPLEEFHLKVTVKEFSSELSENVIKKGDKFSANIFIPTTEAQDVLYIRAEIRFVLAGLYPIKITVEQL
jgi:phage portal protein BeeE